MVRSALSGIQALWVPFNRRRTSHGVKSIITCAGIMSKYQYVSKSKQLREEYGIDVKDFSKSHRVLRQGCSGQDVLLLQQFLVEESYLAGEEESMNGYFGNTTSSALKMWQHDAGVPATGVFDDTSRLGYLDWLENTEKLSDMSPDKGEWYCLNQSVPAVQRTRVLEQNGYIALGMVSAAAALVILAKSVAPMFKGRSLRKVQRDNTQYNYTNQMPYARQEGGGGVLQHPMDQNTVTPVRATNTSRDSATRNTYNNDKYIDSVAGARSERMDRLGYDTMASKRKPGPVRVVRPYDDPTLDDEFETQLVMHDENTVIMQDKPVKLHKPSRLMK